MPISAQYLRIAVMSIAIIFSFIYGIQETDFYVFLNAASRLVEHAPIYAAPHYHGLQYYYSPFFAVILVPFSVMPFFVAATAWVLFSLYLVYVIWRFSAHYLDGSLLSPAQSVKWGLGSFFFIFSTLIYNISQAQMTIFLVWATLQSFWLFERKKTITGSILLALAINIKIMPVVFLPYLLYRKYYGAFTLTLLFFLSFLFIPAVFIGGGYNMALLSGWWHTINPCNSEHLLESDKLLHSLVSTIPVYLTHTSNELNLRVNLVDIGLENAEHVCTAARILLIVFSLAFLTAKPLAPIKDKLSHYWEISYLLLITPLIFPHQNKYSYFYLFPAMIYIIYFMIVAANKCSQIKYKVLLAYLLVLSVIYTPIIGRDILGDYYFDCLQLYRVQVLCTILFIPALFICSPGRLCCLQTRLRQKEH